MSQENVALVRSGFSAFEQGDVGRLLDLMADDMVTYRADPDGATYHGKDGFLDDIKSKVDDYKQQIIDGKIKVPTKP